MHTTGEGETEERRGSESSEMAARSLGGRGEGAVDGESS